MDRKARFNNFVEKQGKILIGKGHDYTAGKADVDAYANFRIISELLEGCPMTPYVVTMIYMLKHLFALITFSKTGIQESGEGLEGRHLDLANYAFILSDLVADHLDHFIDKTTELHQTRDEFCNAMREKIKQEKKNVNTINKFT